MPSRLRAYGNENREDVVVVVLVDLDDRDSCMDFKKTLTGLVLHCSRQPRVLFRIAIEELETWLLADQTAIKKVYPDARQNVLDMYIQDSQCGT
ncbi:DUF4276 family protein [Desulfosarcina sp. OttesenSCG-928-B08]|nr:DUF4276 family protein [Desulfosarcina sp. OttesenSCG-928-B08]